MTAARDPHQATTPSGMNSSLKSWKESTRVTMVNHESKTQEEVMEELKATVIGQSNEPSNRLTIVNVQVSLDTDEPMNQPMANEVDHAMSAAEVLASMLLHWFANIATYVKHDDDLVFLQKRARVARKPGQQVQMPSQHGKCVKAAKGKHTRVETKKCIGSWGNIQKGKRSKRVRDRNPLSTFLRGGFLFRWR
ncbi:hypothetical protein L1987_23354 [Smallanthus sonchifolius]|uniref:Uncharacterized protein n=1 Tax=Smallanthus sonchifolius TaxID=185202 RepID=A0ACB9IHZ6_9ASTR|nr:hypothetical protein L1987_23354 [Smallanthus sonchifolius]